MPVQFCSNNQMLSLRHAPGIKARGMFILYEIKQCFFIVWGHSFGKKVVVLKEKQANLRFACW